jgi:hypothetical protein
MRPNPNALVTCHLSRTREGECDTRQSAIATGGDRTVNGDQAELLQAGAPNELIAEEASDEAAAVAANRHLRAIEYKARP